MAVDATTQRSRRALLAGLVGGLAAALAGSMGRTLPVAAGLPAVTLGAGNFTSSQTSITNQGTGSGFAGISASGSGVYGTGPGAGVKGQSDDGFGVYGKSTSSYGVYGETSSNYGVVGLSSSSTGVIGLSETGYGVVGTSNTVGVVGESGLGRGGRFSGKKAQIRLEPSSAVSNPASGQRGDMFVDMSGRFWFCKGGTTWVKLACPVLGAA